MTLDNLFAWLKRKLEIKSPSRVWIDVRQKVHSPADYRETPLPWYSARNAYDAYESPELRSAARRVRRLIRRHWFVLMFDPNSATAAGVRAFMSKPPVNAGHRADIYKQMRELLDAGAVVINPKSVDEFMKECGVIK